MSTLKDKIINEAKIIGVLLTPFGIFTKKGCNTLKDVGFPETAGEFKAKHWAYMLLNGGLLVSEMCYSIFAIGYGDINYKHWPKIEEQRMISEKLDGQNNLRQEFKRLDSNKDAVIDSTEFIYRRDRK